MSEMQPNPPRLDPIPPGTETCDCCAGVERDTPVRAHNRPGLTAIAYRIGTYTQFRASLHAGLSSSEFATLAQLRTRDDDDFTIGLLDAVACAADVLTFYQERIANESYLRTATERLSLEEMGRLIGYRLRPGVAAETWLAFTLETPPQPPANLKPEPGMFVTGVPGELALEAPLAVRSVPAPGEKPQVFETLEPLTARPQWNALQPWLSDEQLPRIGDQFTYFKGVRNNLKAGDALVFLGHEYLANQNNNNWDFRILDRVELQPEQDRTFVSWKRPLGSIDPPANPAQRPQAFALRKRASVYGHNAPSWSAMSEDFQNSYEEAFPRSNTLTAFDDLAFAFMISLFGREDWPQFKISPVAGSVDLDAVYSEVTPASYVVLAKGGFNYPVEPAPADTYVELYTATNVAEVSREEFALSGKVTRLSLTGANYAEFSDAVRATSAFVQSEPVDFAEYPVDTPVSGASIPVNVSAEGLEPGRRLLVRGVRVSDGLAVVHAVTLVAAHPITSAKTPRCTLEVAPPLSASLVRNSVVVHANVALASHGETVAQILGSGNASQAFQRFELRQLPLTWRAAANELGAASELTVRVDDIEWRESDTLFGTTADERVFALQGDEQGRNFVQFGDGVRGARLPSGSNNVRATYRKGLGAAGNTAADSVTQLATRPLGLKGVSNPLPAAGGTDPESADQARATMPLMTRTLGRAVSLLDYEDFARAFSGVAKAQAQVLRLHTGPTVVITIAGPNNTVLSADNPVWNNLRDALAASGDPHVPVRLLSHQKSTFRVGLKVKRDPAHDIKTVLAAVERALRSHYSFDARELGQPVQQSEVVAVAHSVPGVAAVDLDFLYGGTQPPPQTQPPRHTRLLAVRMGLQAGVLTAAEILTLSPAPFERLEEMK